MRYALVALAADMSLSSISPDSLASEIVPLYAVAVVIFATLKTIAAILPGYRGLLRLQLTRG